MRLNRTGAAVTALAAGLLVLTGCSTVSTGAQEVALAYGGGSFDSANFVKCYGGGFKSTTEGASDTYRYYPTGQRDFSFGSGEGLDSAALTSTTRGAITLQVEGTVKFTMNLSCELFDQKDEDGKKIKTWPGGTAQFFHELIGSKDFDGGHAYNEEGSQSYGPGWSGMLRQYMGFAVNRVVDDSALTFTREELTTDPVAKSNWEQAVTDTLPDVLKGMTGNVEIFRIEKVLLQRPEPPKAIANANVEKEAATIRAQATDIDKRTAEGFPGGMPAWLEYQDRQARNEALKIAAEKGQAIPVPYGSPMIIQGR